MKDEDDIDLFYDDQPIMKFNFDIFEHGERPVLREIKVLGVFARKNDKFSHGFEVFYSVLLIYSDKKKKLCVFDEKEMNSHLKYLK